MYIYEYSTHVCIQFAAPTDRKQRRSISHCNTSCNKDRKQPEVSDGNGGREYVYMCLRMYTYHRSCVCIYIYIYTYVNIPHIESIQDSATLWGCNTLQRIPQHILQRMLHYRSKVIKSWRRNRQKRIHRAAAMHCDSHCNTCCNTDRKQSSVPDGTGKRGCVLLLQHSALQQTATHPATHTATRTATQIESNEEFQKELAKGDTSLDSASADQLRDQVFDCICLYKYICTCVQIYK